MTLKEFKEVKDLSHGDLAKMLGLHISQLSRYLSGTTIPSIPMAVKINRRTEGKVGLHDWKGKEG